MKKFTLLFFAAVLATTVAFGQTAFWSETFGSGIPAGWVNSGTANGSPVNGMWKVTKTGSNGAYSGGFILKSPTGGAATAASNNGYLIFDSDSLDTGGPGGAQGSGPYQSPQRGYLTTSSISCSGHSHVYLEFYDYVIRSNDNTRIVVDNGTSSDTIETNASTDRDYAGIFSKYNPMRKHYDITRIAANQANVKITFLWDGDYYFWMIDDVKLLDGPNNDLMLEDASSIEYYTYPLSQLDSVFYAGAVVNLGSATQPNTIVKATIKKGNTVLFVDSSAAADLPYNDLDTSVVYVGTNPWVPAANTATGVYTSVVSTRSDSADAFFYDNSDTTIFSINDSVYAIDNGIEDNAFYVYNNNTAYEWANIFEVVAADTLTSITTSIAGGSGGTVAGSVIQGKVYSLDPQTFTPTAVISTEARTLQASDIPANGYTIKPVVMKLDLNSGANGPSSAILQPGFYAVTLTAVSSPGTVVIHSTTKKAKGSLSGELANSAFTFYRNTNMYIRANFGHKLNLLTASFTRSGTGSSVKSCTPITYTANSNGTPGTATYDWTFDDGQGTVVPVSGGTSKTVQYTFPAPGTYTVCLTVTDNGFSTTTCKTTVVTQGCSGINDVEELANISLMPNPTNGNVTIKAEDVNGAVKIQMFNILGSEVKEFNETANGTFAKQFNISDLANGNYIVRIQNGERMTTRRLTVSK
jgi:PKD repeat protein